jgi:type VI secretion system protein ImpG
MSGDIRQLDVTARCTNRDLPIGLSFGKSRLEFELEGGAPLEGVRCLAGPTMPRPSPAFGDTAWRLIGQLTLNYLSICDSDPERGAELLRHLLGLYADPNDPVAHRQVDGVRRVSHKPSCAEFPVGAHYLRPRHSVASPWTTPRSKASAHCGSAPYSSASSRVTCRSIHSSKPACTLWRAGR